MPTSKSDSDIVLSKTDGSSSIVGIKLHKNTSGLPGGYRIEHLSPAPPRQATDAANYQQQSPDIGLVLDQQTWHRGFGSSFIEQFGTASEANAAKAVYGYTEDALAMFKGEITTGYLVDETDTMLRNGRFESVASDDYTIDPWDKKNSDDTAGSFTFEAETNSSYVRNGKAGAKVVTTGTSQYVTQTLNSASLFQSRKIFLHGYLKRVSGSGNATVSIIESGGSSTPTTSSQAITNTDFENIHSSGSSGTDLNVTIQADTTGIEIRVTFSASGDTWAMDDFSIIPEGGVVSTQPQEFGGNVYVGCGRQILQWDDTNNYWKPVYWDSAYSITSLANYKSVLYAALGEYAASAETEGSMIVATEQKYKKSTNGTTWAFPDNHGSNNQSKASYFATARNASGDMALIKTRANAVNVSTDGEDTANWGTEIVAGNSDRSIVSLFSSNDILYVGREDGLMAYDRATNKFLDLQPEANFFPDENNFRVAQGRSGSIFACGGDQSFFKISPGSYSGSYVWEDQSYLFKAPTFRGFGGRISGLAQDKNNLFVALADDLGREGGFPYTFPFALAGAGISKTVKLMSVRTQRESGSSAPEEIAHTMASFTVTQVYHLGKFQGSERNSLFIFGSNIDDNANDSSNNKEPRIFRVRMPVRNENPALNAVTEQQFSGNFYTPFINFNFPDVNKTGVKLTLTGLNLDSNKYVTVYYKTDDDSDDDDAGWNTWGSDGQFTSSGQTVAASLSTLTNFDRIRFKITFTSNVNSSAPRITSLVFHAAWNPIDYRKWTAVAKLTDRRSLQLRRTLKSGLSSTDITNLETLRQEPFVLFTDIDGTSHYVNLKFTDDLISNRIYANRNVSPDQTRLFTLEMTEVKTT